MKVRAIVKQNKSSILVLVVKIRVSRTCTIRIVNNSSFFNLISLPSRRLDLEVKMSIRRPTHINNYLK